MSTHGKRAVRQRLRAATTAAAAMALLAAPLCITTSASAAEAHVDNPYAGATQYVNPTYWRQPLRALPHVPATPPWPRRCGRWPKQPTAVWMDRISAITGNADGNGLKFHLDNAVAQKGSGPIVFNLVIYDLPGRDCYALASNGELPATDAGLARYKTEYIDPIAALLATRSTRTSGSSATIEPDSLPNLVTNISRGRLPAGRAVLQAGVKYALDKLHAIPNVYNYIDIGHSGWLGWDEQRRSRRHAVRRRGEVHDRRASRRSTGFVSDVANTTPLNEPFLPDSTISVGGTPIRSSSFYEWNFDFDETDFTAHMLPPARRRRASRRRSACSSTPRATAGAAPPVRPPCRTSTNHNTYVNESRVDKRVHRGAWCNPLGAGIGELPQATPVGLHRPRTSTRSSGSSPRVSPTVRRPRSRTTRASGSTACATRPSCRPS